MHFVGFTIAEVSNIFPWIIALELRSIDTLVIVCTRYMFDEMPKRSNCKAMLHIGKNTRFLGIILKSESKQSL
ncbi:hypothetical protein LguiA_018905 [Lonicera macranthoides]